MKIIKIIVACFVMLLSFAIVSCDKNETAKKTQLLGIWECGTKGGMHYWSYEYKANNTFIYKYDGIDGKKTCYGTYTYEPPHLTRYYDDKDYGIEYVIIKIDGDRMEESYGFGDSIIYTRL